MPPKWTHSLQADRAKVSIWLMTFEDTKLVVSLAGWVSFFRVPKFSRVSKSCVEAVSRAVFYSIVIADKSR